MKKIAILGSTGSIGRQVLDVVEKNRDKYEVVAISANTSIELLEEQIKKFNPEIIAVYNKEQAEILKKKFPLKNIVFGMDGLIDVATCDSDIVISAIVGSIGLIPTIRAIEKNKVIGLANKEVLVSAGEYVMRLAKEKKATLLPIDSEHNAIFQCLKGEDKKNIKRLILTASGGPFLKYNSEQFKDISLKDALVHNYSMGRKITVDCSTLMNKGLEVIEAHYLFDIPVDKIEVVIHPQSIVHSMVEFIDGSIKAQMSNPNMIIPIQYVLSYPDRIKNDISFDFSKSFNLEFLPPDYDKFTCLRLAIDSLKKKKSFSCYLNAANEVLVNRFMENDIGWHEIAEKLQRLLSFHRPKNMLDLNTILEVDEQARKEAKEI